jgi:hypothetical protein
MLETFDTSWSSWIILIHFGYDILSYDKPWQNSRQQKGGTPSSLPRSFNDTHKVYSRLEAMKVAKEQAGSMAEFVRKMSKMDPR